MDTSAYDVDERAKSRTKGRSPVIIAYERCRDLSLYMKEQARQVLGGQSNLPPADREHALEEMADRFLETSVGIDEMLMRMEAGHEEG